MEQIVLKDGAYTLTGLLPRGVVRQAIYFHGPADLPTQSGDLLERAGAACICIEGEDWNADLTPWPAERVFAKGEDFRGEADAYLRVLVDRLLPLAEERLHIPPAERSIAGASLAGLFAVYAAYETRLFDKLCSVSGSLWYDGFVPYMEQNDVSPALRKAYFSVGSREKNTKNPRMRRVEDCTGQAARILERQGVETRFEINPGNHFADGAARLRKGLAFLLGLAEHKTTVASDA